MENLKTVTGPTRELPKEFYERMADFYISQYGFAKVSHIWNDIFNMFHKPLHDALVTGNPEAIAEQFSKLYDGMTLFGVDLAKDMTPEVYSKVWMKALISTANNLAVWPVANPEQPVELETNILDIIERIEKSIGTLLTRMGGGGMFGIEINGRFIPHHLLEAAGIAGSIKRYLDDYQFQPGDMLEIGAGVGNLCYVLATMFRNDPFAYHTIDLPIMSCIQAYLLEISLPGHIWFAGEGVAKQRIFIHGIKPSGFVEGESFTVAINQDAMPEMPLEVADKYADIIERRLIRYGFFLSINHESTRGGQINVHDLFKSRNAFTLVHRCPYWGRAGYVEELWRKETR